MEDLHSDEVIVMRRPDPLRHPKAREAFGLLREDRMSRREFVRIAALLGASAASAYALAGLPDAATADEHGLPFAEPDAEAKPGGILRIAMQVMPMDDPATFTWVQASNQARHTLENLTVTGPDNITRPMLAERWEAADDLRSWTFTLRENVLWHNGEPLTAEHVKWNLERWCDPKLGSANISLSTFAAMIEDVESGAKDASGNPLTVKRLSPGAIEVVDARTIRLNLRKPVLSVPEDLYNFPTAILHPSFKGPVGPDTLGTGAYRIASYELTSHCTLERVKTLPDGRPFEYWGGPVMLDEIRYIHFDAEFQLIAFAAGQVDMVHELGFDQLDYARSLDGSLLSAPTAQTLCCRFQIDVPPFDDARVRQALVLAVDNKPVKEAVFPVDGSVGQNHHVAPIHPEYFELPVLERDLEQARTSAEGRGPGEPRPQDRHRQYGRHLASAGLRGDPRPAEGGRRPPRHRGAAAGDLLGHVGQGAVGGDAVDAPAARHPGTVLGLPLRGALERDPLLLPGLRPRARRGRNHARSVRAEGEDGAGAADPPGRLRDVAAGVPAGLHAGRQGRARHRGASDAVSSVAAGLGRSGLNPCPPPPPMLLWPPGHSPGPNDTTSRTRALSGQVGTGWPKESAQSQQPEPAFRSLRIGKPVQRRSRTWGSHA